MIKKSVILLLVVLAMTLLYGILQNQFKHQNLELYQQWKTKYDVQFSSQLQQIYRIRVFYENFMIIKAHNALQHRTYDMGLNQFSALTDKQFQSIYLKGFITKKSAKNNLKDQLSVGDVDWVSQGAVTAVKNQGQCGSCWAFSATGALQGLSKLNYGSLESFSEQQLVDCSTSYGNLACNGGLMDNAFKYVKDRGIAHQQQYPYKAYHQSCLKNGGAFKISGFVDLQSCNDLLNALSMRPISVGVDAGTWSKYSSGILSNCGSDLNHGVLVVGVTDQYWKVKNSWSSSWGQNGYIRLARGNTCGICEVASYPTK